MQQPLVYSTNRRYGAYCFVFASTGVFAEVRVARGETVGLRLNPADCHRFPADQ
jgi:hypothetical protein